MYEGSFLQTRLLEVLNVSIDQKNWPRIYFKTCGLAFETSAELFKRSAVPLRVYEKTKSSAESLKSSAACLHCNTVHAVPISHGRKHIIQES